ncbi:hypothetical protein Acid345_2774 [Candidatus Koribacter versatilis Ellin345]|uniref:Uncharacterized protein n=1 Tax=Koribacter versatilis (strain Ellin345) TaxID=204669 RepID=Q1IMX5_KORVE|nr:hypothetical protein [Candidatus Koribacter versatilis]ABF41775.1 hypothetical protein Acid345_2774 [Candidatus Koribacter versatilis Ellin345]
MPHSSDQTMFVILGARPSISFRVAETTSPVELERRPYGLLEKEVGFYDFLRNREAAVIGLRFSFFSKQKVLKDTADLDYIYVDEKRQYIEIYLQGYRGSAIQEPGEQAFGDDAIWRSEQGIYALQVGTDKLTDSEIESLKSNVPPHGK